MSYWVLLQPNHFFTAFCGQRVSFGCVATFVLGYKSHSVAGLNTLTLTVMLCSSHSFHPSFPNTVPASLRRLLYGRILPFDSSETEVCKHPTDLHGHKLQLTTILIINSEIIFLMNCQLLVQKMASVFSTYFEKLLDLKLFWKLQIPLANIYCILKRDKKKNHVECSWSKSP